MEDNLFKEPGHPELPHNPEAYLPATALTAERLSDLLTRRLADVPPSSEEEVYTFVPADEYRSEMDLIGLEGPAQAVGQYGLDAVGAVTVWSPDETEFADPSYVAYVVRRRSDGDCGIERRVAAVSADEIHDLVGLYGEKRQIIARDAAATDERMAHELGLNVASEAEVKHIMAALESALPEAIV